MSTTCTCEGPKEDDCDAYAQMLAGTFLTSEKFMGIFMHMDTASKEYHIENVSSCARLESENGEGRRVWSAHQPAKADG